MNEGISMSIKETERINVMDNLIAKRIKQNHAAKQLGISVRQVQRMVKRYKREGMSGLPHKSRGKTSNRALSPETRDQIVFLLKRDYPDFGPTFAAEQLFERDGITVSKETVRQLMIKEQLRKAKQHKRGPIHTYRDRRPCVGELTQLDGSPHAWFEDRGAPCTLLAYIDDATSQIMDGEFVDFEGTFNLFSATEHYLLTHGKPVAFYVDKHSTFKVNRQATIEEELKDLMPQSQFGRALDQLRIELIFAHSSEAKGRVERLFETLQDRLVKAMRLANISTKREATRYFREVYIPKHNAKFAVAPKDPTNVHRALFPSDDLARIFTVQSLRHVSKVLVVQYKNTRYQLDTTNTQLYFLKNQKILVEENKAGTLVFRHNEKVIPYTRIGEVIREPKIVQIASAKTFQEQHVLTQMKDPWATPIMPAL